MAGKNSFMVFLVFFIAVFTLFFFTVSPDPEFKEIMNWNLLLIGSIGGFVLLFATQKQSELWFPVLNGKEVLFDFVPGVIIGLITVVGVSLSLMFQKTLLNLIGSINLASLGVISSSSNLMVVVLLQPITETILLVSSILVLDQALQRLKVPFRGLIAVVLVALLFAGFHFTVASQKIRTLSGELPVSFSLNGFFQFIFSGNPGFTGFPQFIMGLIWGFTTLIYKRYLVPLIAHVFNNFLAVYLSGLVVGDALALMQVIGLVLIVFFVLGVYYNGFKVLTDFKFSRIMGV